MVQQLNQSDLAFLRERARLVQAELWCTGRTLHFRSRTSRRGTALTLVQGNELLWSRVSADLAHQRSEVVVTGYDATTKEVIDERAGKDMVKAEAAQGRTGPRSSAGPREQHQHPGPRDGAQRRRGPGLGAGGDAAPGPGVRDRDGRGQGRSRHGGRQRLRLELIGAPFEGDGYYVTQVCHTFDHVQGLRTRFEAERPTLNEVA